MEERRRLYEKYDDAVKKYKSSKDSTALVNERKKIDASYRSISAKIADCETALAKDQPESSDKVRNPYRN